MRHYTKNLDISKLPAHEQPKTERNLEVANLWAQGYTHKEIQKIISEKFSPIGPDRINQILKSWKTMAEKGGSK